jgi:small conductance mechanosensitive channel
MLNTQLTTSDNKLITLPNSKVMGDKIVNHTALGTRRVELEISVPPNNDVFEFREKVRALVAEDRRILSEPASEIQLSGSSVSDAKILVRPWVKTADYDAVSSSMQEKLLDAWPKAEKS